MLANFSFNFGDVLPSAFAQILQHDRMHIEKNLQHDRMHNEELVIKLKHLNFMDELHFESTNQLVLYIFLSLSNFITLMCSNHISVLYSFCYSYSSPLLCMSYIISSIHGALIIPSMLQIHMLLSCSSQVIHIYHLNAIWLEVNLMAMCKFYRNLCCIMMLMFLHSRNLLLPFSPSHFASYYYTLSNINQLRQH